MARLQLTERPRRMGVGRRRHARIPAILGQARLLLYPEASIARGHSIFAEMGGGASAYQLLNQQAENWCWAAVLQSILLVKNVRETQMNIVAAHKGEVCPITAMPQSPQVQCSESRCPNPCNSMHNLRIAMMGQNCFGAAINLADRSRALATLRNELSASRPVAARIAQPPNLDETGHFILIAHCQPHGANPEIQFLCPSPPSPLPAPVAPTAVFWNNLLDGFNRPNGIYRLTHLYSVAV